MGGVGRGSFFLIACNCEVNGKCCILIISVTALSLQRKIIITSLGQLLWMT